MMQAIFAKGRELGDPNGCVVCHAGTPAEIKDKDKAHSGAPAGSRLAAFTATPGALQLNEATCDQCHADHVYAVTRSHMNTDAGKMKAITWSWGIGTRNHDHIYGDHDLDDQDGMTPRFGTDAYKEYMQDLSKRFPGQFPQKLQQIPEVDMAKLAEQPEQAAFTYLRNCNACHLSGKGYQDRGHFRGVGCAACHTLYSNEGYYEGGDKALPRDRPGHLMTHAMQGTRNSATTVNGVSLSGIQVNTCAACHAAGRRIGHAYQGLMAFGHGDHRGPFDEKGNPQKANGGYVFKFIREDVHFALKDINGKQAGLLCQDCHLTTSMHGNGNIGATTLATIEVECADCHGTPDKYPWELPLGYGDEFGKPLDWNRPRGVSREAMKVTQAFADTPPAEDGYLLSARGNPFGNVVRRGNKVIVHSANGHDFELTPLKALHQASRWASPARAVTAMVGVRRHMDKLECYACHSTWAAQYYGYQYAVDYRQRSTDWLKTAEQQLPDGSPADRKGRMSDQPGAPTSWDYSHVRWENPPLGVNGEGRVTPLVGVIQTVGTVIGPDGKTLAWNRVARTGEGYNAMELAPLNPHTSSRESRNCADCHGNPAAIGYGIDEGRYGQQPEKTRYAKERSSSCPRAALTASCLRTTSLKNCVRTAATRPPSPLCKACLPKKNAVRSCCMRRRGQERRALCLRHARRHQRLVYADGLSGRTHGRTPADHHKPYHDAGSAASGLFRCAGRTRHTYHETQCRRAAPYCLRGCHNAGEHLYPLHESRAKRSGTESAGNMGGHIA